MADRRWWKKQCVRIKSIPIGIDLATCDRFQTGPHARVANRCKQRRRWYSFISGVIRTRAQKISLNINVGIRLNYRFEPLWIETKPGVGIIQNRADVDIIQNRVLFVRIGRPSPELILFQAGLPPELILFQTENTCLGRCARKTGVRARTRARPEGVNTQTRR